MGLLGWVIVGLIVGVFARVLLPGRSPVGCLGTIFIGMAGAAIGGKLWFELFGRQRGVAWIGSILVAMLLLAVFRWLTPQDRW